MCCDSHRSRMSGAEIDRIVREAQLERNRRNDRRRELYAQRKLDAILALANKPVDMTPMVIEQPTKVEAPKERALVLA